MNTLSYGPFISRKEALRQGLQWYFTGKPCKHGHVDLRYSTTFQCLTCKRAWSHENNSVKSSLTHQYRPGFELSCSCCNKKIIRNGGSHGFEGAKACKINDSYGVISCSKACSDQMDRQRNGDARNRRSKLRYANDPVFRAKRLEKSRKERQNPQYKARQAAYYKDWASENKAELNKYKLSWFNQKLTSDPTFKILAALRHRFYMVLTERQQTKTESVSDLLGCSIEEARDHLESQFKEGMSWQNHGEWHIDHIRPCASFEDPADSACWNYSNLQPLWASENCAKRDKWEAVAA